MSEASFPGFCLTPRANVRLLAVPVHLAFGNQPMQPGLIRLLGDRNDRRDRATSVGDQKSRSCADAFQMAAQIGLEVPHAHGIHVVTILPHRD